MADPWAEFRAAPASPPVQGDPWAEFRAERSVSDKLLGIGGERFQTWPERLIRGLGGAIWSGVTLPRDVLKEAQQPAPTTISDSDVSTLSVGRVLDAVGLSTPLNPAIRAGDRMVPGMAKTLAPAKVPAPTAEELRRVGGGQIEQARNMGVELSPESVRQLGATLEAQLQNKGINDVLAEKTFGILRELRSPPEGAVVTFGNLQTLRRSLSEAAKSVDPTERKAAVEAIRGLDEWMSAVPEGAVLAGPSAAERAAAAENAALASAVYKRGRGNYAAAERSDDITGRAEAADLRAAATYSGKNIGNATRQRFVDLLTNDAKARGYSEKELAAVERLVRGTRGMNASRYIGNLFGGGGGLGQAVTAGGSAALGAGLGTMVGNPVAGAGIGAIVPTAVGAGSRAVANALTKYQARKVDELVRRRSPLFLERQAEVPMEAQGIPTREALIRALMMSRDRQ